jgi:hypothetical protein
VNHHRHTKQEDALHHQRAKRVVQFPDTPHNVTPIADAT